MMLSFSFGPLLVSPQRLLFLIAFATALLAGWLSGRRERITVEPVLMQMLVCGLVAGRLGFVWLYWDDFSANPVRVIDIRDGGFSLAFGIAIAAVIALVQTGRHLFIRRHLATAIASGAMIWIAGTAALQHLAPSTPPLAQLPFVGLDGFSHSSPGLYGKPLVVNLWATWCPPCRREMPLLAEAQMRETGVEFIFISQGEDGSAVREYLEREDLSLRNVFLDTQGEWAAQFGAAGMPTTLFLDASGQLQHAHTGELSRASLRLGLNKILHK